MTQIVSLYMEEVELRENLRRRDNENLTLILGIIEEGPEIARCWEK